MSLVRDYRQERIDARERAALRAALDAAGLDTWDDDMPDPPDPAVMYGLLTLADVTALRRRRSIITNLRRRRRLDVLGCQCGVCQSIEENQT